MKKKVCFWAFMIPIILILGFIIYVIIFTVVSSNGVQKADLSDYLDTRGYEHFTENGYIANEKAARAVGAAIIEGQLDSKDPFGVVWVDYDENLRLWRVAKGYPFSSQTGAYVIIEQDTGKVVTFSFTKD